MEKLKLLQEKLNKLGYISLVFENEQQVKEKVASLITKDEQVCFGGSLTTRNMLLPQYLIENGYNVCFENNNLPYAMVKEQNINAKVYIASCNAITKDGVIVNLDGTGNRIAGLSFGPKKVFYIVGKNKVVENLDEAVYRIKNVAAPLNAKRLGKKTPCVVTGKCENCSSPDRICMAYMINLCALKGKDTYVFLVDKDLGL